ncbi:MAG: ATP-grasp domain-containing protein [Bdellovibrionales bacterium]|nr:ATP-grasp domain-containing protein [Bdellovibrionales bacterium]
MNKTSTIRRILIANQGEIVMRIAKTLRSMKIESLAPYLFSQKFDPYVQCCDLSAELEGNDLSAYLDMDQMIHIAKKFQCQAIHPGYGFLSENAAFARRCQDNDIIFIGPHPDCLEVLGDKAKAKQIAKDAGLFVLKSVVEEDSTENFLQNANAIGFPVLLKPVAGGGGKGMFLVANEKEFRDKMAEAKQLAKNAFGNDQLMAEQYLASAKHVEVQVAGDVAKNAIHFFERDCSLQRRHQKVIEESESSVPSDVLSKIHDASLQLIKTLEYNNIGTVEFLVDTQNHNHYFMEVNPRLQVEHSVTEMCTEVDLVKLQVQLACSQKLTDLFPHEVSKKAYAIEARIYAENAESGFLPASGRILHLSYPEADEHMRVDTNAKALGKISHLFDPMIMKITVHRENRVEGIKDLKSFLHSLVILGVDTNINFLLWCMEEEDFLSQNHDTKWMESKHADYLAYKKSQVSQLSQSLHSIERQDIVSQSLWKTSPWLGLQKNSNTLESRWSYMGESLSYDQASDDFEGISVRDGDHFWIHDGKYTYHVKRDLQSQAKQDADLHSFIAPITGTLCELFVKSGDEVKVGQAMAQIEAMKMRYTISSSSQARVKKVFVRSGDLVEEGQILGDLEKQ